MYKSKQFKTLKQVYTAVDACMNTILTSNLKKEITLAFQNIQCILLGKCICDMCPEWESNSHLVMETGRCIIPSRFMQLVIERHLQSKRWIYIQPLYEELFKNLYSDILPNLKKQESNGEMEDQNWCKYTLSEQLIKKTLQIIKAERAPAVAAKLEKLKKLYPNMYK